jgi:hypothetical protein
MTAHVSVAFHNFLAGLREEFLDAYKTNSSSAPAQHPPSPPPAALAGPGPRLLNHLGAVCPRLCELRPVTARGSADSSHSVWVLQPTPAVQAPTPARTFWWDDGAASDGRAQHFPALDPLLRRVASVLLGVDALRTRLRVSLARTMSQWVGGQLSKVFRDRNLYDVDPESSVPTAPYSSEMETLIDKLLLPFLGMCLPLHASCTTSVFPACADATMVELAEFLLHNRFPVTLVGGQLFMRDVDRLLNKLGNPNLMPSLSLMVEMMTALKAGVGCKRLVDVSKLLASREVTVVAMANLPDAKAWGKMMKERYK